MALRKRDRLPNYPFYDLVREDRYDPKVYNGALDVARRRIGGLCDYMQAHRPLIDILANAYMIGLEDGADCAFKMVQEDLEGVIDYQI